MHKIVANSERFPVMYGSSRATLLMDIKPKTAPRSVERYRGATLRSVGKICFLYAERKRNTHRRPTANNYNFI